MNRNERQLRQMRREWQSIDWREYVMCACRFVSLSCYLLFFVHSFVLLVSSMIKSTILISNAIQLFFSRSIILLKPTSSVESSTNRTKRILFDNIISLYRVAMDIFQEIKLSIVRYVYVMQMYAVSYWHRPICPTRIHRQQYSIEMNVFNQAQNILPFWILNLYF